MIKKDLDSHLRTNFSAHKKTLTDLSMRANGDTSLVIDNSILYDFDKISQSFYSPNNYPASADCINATGKEVVLIEFKSGFKQKITKDSIQKDKFSCTEVQDRDFYCQSYWNLFFKNQKNERKILINSIIFKAIDSYFTLKKHMICKCESIEKKIPINLFIVIDEDPINSMIDALGGFPKNQKNTSFVEISEALKRVDLITNSENDPIYNRVKVMSTSAFLTQVQRGAIPTLE